MRRGYESSVVPRPNTDSLQMDSYGKAPPSGGALPYESWFERSGVTVGAYPARWVMMGGSMR